MMKPAITFLALAATLAPLSAEARPRHRHRPTAARPLVRARPTPTATTVAPLVGVDARPVCGNVMTKGPGPRTEVCTDPIGTSEFRFPDGKRTLVQRVCTADGTTVIIDEHRHVQELTIGRDGAVQSREVALRAPDSPLIAACRRGMP